MSSYRPTYHENEEKDEMASPPVSSQRTFPPAPFPRTYVHCVFDDLYDVVHAVYALRADGHNAGDIHVMSCWDYVEAVERERQQQGSLSKLLRRLFDFLDEGFGDVYLREALQGNHVLMVRLSRAQQIKRVCDMLMLHHARRVRYVDTWTVTYLSPSTEEVGC